METNICRCYCLHSLERPNRSQSLDVTQGCSSQMQLLLVGGGRERSKRVAYKTWPTTTSTCTRDPEGSWKGTRRNPQTREIHGRNRLRRENQSRETCQTKTKLVGHRTGTSRWLNYQISKMLTLQGRPLKPQGLPPQVRLIDRRTPENPR